MIIEATYLTYLLVSISMTVWVAKTLSQNGAVFLIDSFSGNEALAKSVNHLLVVGFYLVNMGYVTLILKYGDKPTNLQQAIEFFSTKIGLVLLVLGVMHFFNVIMLNRYREKAALRKQLESAC
ncbi:hypothetical protein [Pleionea sp. CnH1-48]|uniref:hypothetical protein n=1 Tax=Pleionea sp. CnH1-48 TaxID=2954494 RepID=UPI002096D686|nr:hypothetical protein [Pleionea sp. CnH1-48]MCO7226474.1 hypothetical protein [Pleionea sp. CnH1-48]